MMKDDPDPRRSRTGRDRNGGFC